MVIAFDFSVKLGQGKQLIRPIPFRRQPLFLKYFSPQKDCHNDQEQKRCISKRMAISIVLLYY